MKIGDVLEKGDEVTVWVCKAGSYRRLKKKIRNKKNSKSLLITVCC